MRFASNAKKVDVYGLTCVIFTDLSVRPRRFRTYVPVLLFEHGSAADSCYESLFKHGITADLGPAVNRQPLFTPYVARSA